MRIKPDANPTTTTTTKSLKKNRRAKGGETISASYPPSITIFILRRE